MAGQNSQRSAQAFERRLERESQKQLRELERRNKELAKLSALEQARLEVETHQNRIDLLLSMHKEQSEPWDWFAIKAALPPPVPEKKSYREDAQKQLSLVCRPCDRDASLKSVENARREDEASYQQEFDQYSKEKAESNRMRELATRIVAGEHRAYQEALKEFNPFKEVSDLCSKLRFVLHSSSIMICDLKMRGEEAIPFETKTLSSSGKVIVKPLPRARFNELYQDCLCSCMLRVAREIFAMLPIETLLITASVDMIDSSTGKTVDGSVLSVAMLRPQVLKLNFDRLDPTDCLDQFNRRGDFKASRKAGAFISIAPLTPADISSSTTADLSIPELITNVCKMRDELVSVNSRMNSESDSVESEEWSSS